MAEERKDVPAAGGICVVLRHAAREVYGRLMDAVEPGLVDLAEQTLTEVPGVVGVGDVRLRWVGHSLRAEAEITVAGSLSVADGHGITVAAERALVRAVPRLAGATVHADPDSAPGRGHHDIDRAPADG